MKRIKSKYITVDDNKVISTILNHIAARLNSKPGFRYNYQRNEHWITMQIRINGRWLKLNADITKSDIIAEIDRKLRNII